MPLAAARALRLHGGALALFFGLAFLTLHPILFTTNTHTAGYDFFNYNWNFWWIRHALTTPGLNVYENDFVMFPAVSNYGYHALTAFWYPLWALLEPLTGTLAAVNVIIVASAVLNGYLMFVFLRAEEIHAGLALVGAAALQVLPISRYFYYNTHLNLMDWFWLPALLLLWRRTAEAVLARGLWPGAAWGLAVGALLWALMLTDLQFPIFAAFLIVPYGLLTLARAWRAGRDRLLALLAVGALAVGFGLLLRWFAGPLPYIMRFEGTLTPGPVEDRPGIPFPGGFLSMAEQWWMWHSPSTGAFVTLALIASLIASLSPARRWMSPLRWFWFALCLPPLIFAMGPTLVIGTAELPLPYRWLYALTDGMFRMPWRLAPAGVIAGMAFAGMTWTPIIQRALRRPGGRAGVVFGLAGALLALAVSVRLFESAPLDPAPYPYSFYRAIGAERGPGYDELVVVQAPTGAGTGEVLLGDMRAIQLQWYGLDHGKRMVNGFISRAPIENFWYIVVDDPLLSWLGQRVPLDPPAVEAQLRQRIAEWPIGYIIVHTDLIGREGPTVQEIVGYFNTLPGLLCFWTAEGPPEAYAIAFRTAAHPDGCPPRTPPQDADGAYVIDLGAPGDERFIGWGWHWQEDVFGTTLRWAGEHPQARVYVDLPPGAYRLELAAQAFWEARTVTVQVNGATVGEVAAEPDVLRGVSVEVPAGVIGSGRQVELVLAYDDVVVPAEVGQSADPRRLSVAVASLRFVPLEKR
jgi:hypothetical protein